MRKVIGFFVATLVCSAVQSEDYFAAGITAFDIDGGGNSLNLASITGTYGRSFSDHMSGELRFGIGVNDDSIIDSFGDTITSEIDHHYGAYLKFSATSGEIKPYAILGITKFKLSAIDSSVGVKESGSEDDFSYGLGVDFGNGLVIEYTQYYDKDGVELNGLSLGIKF